MEGQIMPVPFSSLTSRKEIESAVAHAGAVEPGGEAKEKDTSDNPDFDADGKFATGNRASVANHGGGRPRGIVGLIKAKTKDYETLIDNLLTVSRGQELYKKKPSLKDILDATNSLLDRSIGKPTQQVLHTGDDIAKELLATRQEALRLQKAEVARKAKERELLTEGKLAMLPDVGREVSSLQAMREQAGRGGDG